MNDLQLIEKLERHIGFVYHRLNCDGNWYAFAIKPAQLNVALNKLGEGCLLLRSALVGKEDSATPELVQSMLDSFDSAEYKHEAHHWE